MSNANMDALLDANLDDLADIPEFKPYPAGVHLVTMKLEPKMNNDKLAISANFEYLQPVELGDPSATPPEAGAKANVLCQMDNDFGQGTFKMIAQAVAPALGLDGKASRKEVIEKSQGMTVQIVTVVRTVTKDNETKEYLGLKGISIPA